MKTKIYLSIQLITLIFLSLSVLAQENPMESFEILTGSSWVNEGTQLGGHNGRTEQQFEFGLDGKIVKVKTYSTDPRP